MIQQTVQEVDQFVQVGLVFDLYQIDGALESGLQMLDVEFGPGVIVGLLLELINRSITAENDGEETLFGKL